MTLIKYCALALPLAAACTGEQLGDTEAAMVVTNMVVTNAITSNAIASNPAASTRLGGYPVIGASWMVGSDVYGKLDDPTLSLALEDPAAQMFMKYFAGCAFEPDHVVAWSDHTGQPHEWRGALGLCPQWFDGKPDQVCRERVSGCILGRNNAFGVSVPLSMRGTTPNKPGAIVVGDRAPTHNYELLPTQPVTSQPVPSLEDCRTPEIGETRDCGWVADSIGRCTPGTHVAIATGVEAWCSGSETLGVKGDAGEVLRVCEGTRGCEYKDAIVSVSGGCGTAYPRAAFTCPADGIYAVMIGAKDSTNQPYGVVGSTMIDSSACAHDATVEGGPLSPGCSTCAAAVCDERAECCDKDWDEKCTKLADTACRYPATEERVYRWREGSFYGDLFGSWNLNPAKPIIFVDGRYTVCSQHNGDTWPDGGQHARDFIGVAFPNMYACSARHWNQPAAYMALRVCAGADPQDGQYTRDCAANYVGPCFERCATLEGAPIDGDHDAADCSDSPKPKRVWHYPMTTLLAQPCDAVADPFACGNTGIPDLKW